MPLAAEKLIYDCSEGSRANATTSPNQSKRMGFNVAKSDPSTAKLVPAIFCLHCGSHVAKNTRMSREYCSDECYTERKKILRANPAPPMCAMCNCEFERTSNRQKYCAECRVAKTRKYTADYNSLNYDAILVERREYMRKAKAENPELYRERNRAWWASNREEISARRTTVEAREKANSRFKARYARDHKLVVHARMASAIHQAITKKKAGRKWETIVGYTLEDLVRHIERQFVSGMSWDNMGDWHIDHIIPKSSFNYEDDTSEEFRACWALTNLRPLWADENQKKHAKRTLLL